MKTAIIIDDEKKGIEALKWKIEQNLPSIKIKNTFTNGNTALEYLKGNEVDIIFLDIEMPHINGMELAKQVVSDSKIIFTTAHDNYVLAALRENVFDYLLKPIDVGELKNAIKRLYEKEHKVHLSVNDNKIAISTIDSIIYLEEKNIIYCSSESNYTFFFLIGGKKELVSKTLSTIESDLSSDFIRIHKSYLINKNFVKRYNKGIGGSITLINDIELPVAKSRKNSVLSILG